MEDYILKLPKSLTKDENITLFKKMLNSSKEEAEEIRKNIITGNLRLVVETIKKYRNNVEDQKDLFQIGCIGLIKAVDTFDFTKNMMFSTYATVCISNRVKEYLRKGNMNCGVLGQLKIKIDEYSDEIYKTTGVNPTTEQISEYFNIPHNKVCKALNIRQIESLDNKVIDSESASYADLISTDENIEEEYIKKCERQIIKKFINKLNEKEKTIFNMYFIQDMSQNQISKKLCISQPQVSKKIRKVLEELKTIMLKENEENKHIAMPKIKQM